MAFTIPALFLNAVLLVDAAASSYPTSSWTLQEANKPATVVVSSLEGPIDGPKFDYINSTVYQWWYFDVVSSDLESCLTVQFNIGSELALGFGNASEILPYVAINGKFPNGTLFDMASVPATNITIQTIGQGSSGVWEGTGCSWEGTPDLSEYVLTLNAPEQGIQGSVYLKSISPAQYPFNLLSQQLYNVSESVLPGFYWANSIPGALGGVDLTIRGDRLLFDGSGYHDSNWGTIGLPKVAGSWYWGHAQVGDLTIVFSTVEGRTQTVSSIYIGNDPTLIIIGNVTVTPVTGSNYPNGTLNIALDAAFDGKYEFLIVPTDIVYSTPAPKYTRWIGIIEGGLVGGESQKGVVLWEYFYFG
ncbi:hypothetical protein BGW36DRAFT_354426 [Talaromyces proteolyticus]|uniref:PABS domain-containing protein n=1 Tax=Talaromyces proteolyticus TaxID=1131652 RepID=A0AAD4Q774_9EURO|nr:uncharacterized protein BGW36DRAFT_354426 [Talaromyces proteolyticus]KAH8706047.1 hypothetical protein BGW36DRAFT_354426 [Talaromyces proteolyticus]